MGVPERHDAADARVERLGDALDGSAFAGGVAAFEEHHHAQALVADPLLEFDQLDLQAAQLTFRTCSTCPGARRRAEKAVAGMESPLPWWWPLPFA